MTISMNSMTVGQLRKSLDGLPDDMPVLYQRIEDLYFENYGWVGEQLLWENFRVSPKWLEEMSDEEKSRLKIIEGVAYMPSFSEYIPAFSAYKHPDEEVVVINAHY
jgi:hypothetical protein